MFWWSIYQDRTPIPEFGRHLPTARNTTLANIAVAVVPALTVTSIVAFPDGSPNWLLYVRGFSLIFAAQATIQWVRTMVTNIRLRQRRVIFGKNWAFFGWFLPPFVPIFPALQFSELARKSAPPGRSSAGAQLLVFVWFLTALGWAATQFVAFSYWIDAVDAQPTGAPTPFNTTPREWLIYGAAAQVLGALAFIAMTRVINRQHEAFMEMTQPPPMPTHMGGPPPIPNYQLPPQSHTHFTP